MADGRKQDGAWCSCNGSSTGTYHSEHRVDVMGWDGMGLDWFGLDWNKDAILY
eukprot:CAMPEP_0168247166 /NCGR_PEP_ID=MMETSP0141_2-20121125/742_1 /TAXON_ID=44445 /ORGANISM="Pseudo-nitzschia australis, Strain 10249 10 AB" /LENGTH=52 /DNA_ID=CAMNT_0008182913 /DNA_START=874 /DNA_END=1032 /DNA_ORIENTATION=+